MFLVALFVTRASSPCWWREESISQADTTLASPTAPCTGWKPVSRRSVTVYELRAKIRREVHADTRFFRNSAGIAQPQWAQAHPTRAAHFAHRPPGLPGSRACTAESDGKACFATFTSS